MTCLLWDYDLTKGFKYGFNETLFLAYQVSGRGPYALSAKIMSKDRDILKRWECPKYPEFDHGNFTLWTRAEMRRSPFDYRCQHWEFMNQDHIEALMGHCQKWCHFWDLIREFETYGIDRFRKKDLTNTYLIRGFPLEPQIAAWKSGLTCLWNLDLSVETYTEQEYGAAWAKLRSSLPTRKLDVDFTL